MLKYLFSLIPLLGTSFGSFLGIANSINKRYQKREDILVAVATGILGGILISLFVEVLSVIRNVSVFIGILIGLIFIALLNRLINTRTHITETKLFWAMLFHNIPEGIIIGIALADSTIIKPVTLIISITLQNIPDGFVVSMPLSKYGKTKAFIYGILSGIVEPLISAFIILSAGHLIDISTLESFLIGFSFSAILMITIDMLKECKSIKTVITRTIITALFSVLV